MKKMPVLGAVSAIVAALLLSLGCGRFAPAGLTTSKKNIRATISGDISKENTPPAVQKTYEKEAAVARAAQAESSENPIISPESQATAQAMASSPLALQGRAHIGILYFKDQPAHRLATLNWLMTNHAKIEFEEPSLGYVDASLTWEAVGALIDSRGNLGLDETSLLKLELDDIVPTSGQIASHPASSIEERLGPSLADINSSFFGPAHSAGYGSKVQEFRQQAAGELGVTVDQLDGHGKTIAVYDQGIDLSRTDVFGNRIRDFFIGNNDDWLPVEETLQDFTGATGTSFTPPGGLEDVAAEASLRIIQVPETHFNSFDVNGSGSSRDDAITLAVYESQGQIQVRVRPAAGMPFGDAVVDYGLAQQQGTPGIIDLYTGRHYVRAAVNPSPSAAAFKIKKDEHDRIWVAIVGTANGSDHGISNLHMAGGNYVDPSGSVRYQGVAPGVSFFGMQTWKVDNSEYGSKWIPLARSMVQAATAGADVIDLDIYTPGSRIGNDLLSSLACRITATTESVLVAASHNYGPLPDTIQSLAQSPCVLGIGASHSKAALRIGRNQGSTDPGMTTDDSVQTAHYSGRGFGLNGQFKPDIISPAYGYTAYGRNFIRFSGTSGATPTTAGMIALLKQAAGFSGTRLTHDQVRFLLQSGSDPLRGADSVRDGYGYANLQSTWNFFRSTQAAGHAPIDPFTLSGHTFVAFEGMPNREIIPIKLVRVPTFASIDGPRAMHYWIEFSNAQGGNWLKFYDPAIGAATDELDLDSPLQGEVQNLRLKVNMDAQSFGALPVGQYVAVVKGVRRDLQGGRAVDFIMPVALTKAYDVDESVFTLPNLYADQHVSYALQANPGDRFLFTGQPTCQGQDIATGAIGNNSDGLMFTIDHEASYSHASSVMNSYAPLVLSSTGIQVDAKKSMITFDIRRSGQFNCDGPIGGRITVRRTGATVQVGSIAQSQGASATTIKENFNLALSAGILSNAEINRGAAWKLGVKGSAIIARRDVTGAFSMVVPEGVAKIRVEPANATIFKGVLGTRGASGDWSKYVTTTDNDAAGFGSINTFYGGKYTGLEIESPVAGETLFFNSAGATTRSTIVFEMASDGSSTSAISSTAAVDQWLRNQNKVVSVRTTLPAATAASIAPIFDSEWTFGVRTSLTLTESQANSTGTATAGSVELWSGDVETPVVLPR